MEERIVPGTDLLHGRSLGHRHVALTDVAVGIDIEERGLEQRRAQRRAAAALDRPHPPRSAGGPENQPWQRHRLTALATAEGFGMVGAHAERDVPARRWCPPHQHVAMHVKHRLRQKAAVRGPLEQGRGQFPRRLGGHGPSRADDRRTVHGQNLMHGGKRAARASVVQQHGLVQRQHVVRGCVDGKFRFAHLR